MRGALWMLTLLLLAPGAAAERLFSLAYHDVRDDVNGGADADRYAVSTAQLAAHFRWLRREGYAVVSVDDLVAARQGAQPLPPKAVLLSFDDGLRSTYTHVWPLLKLFGYPAVISVVTSWIDTQEPVRYDHREFGAAEFVSWAQLREMRDSGLVEIASHSHDLHRGVPGNPDGNEQPAATTRQFLDGGYESEHVYRERLRVDLLRSATVLERELGAAPRVMTWPYGAHSATAREVAADAGMQISLSLRPADTQLDAEPALVGRELMVANPGLARLAESFEPPASTPTLRAAQVELDSVFDPDPLRQERNLGRLLDRIKALGISHVFLQAFADPDRDGAADAVYFPNRHLPVRADLFNRAAWQLASRSGVKVYAWMPVTGFTGPDIPDAWRAMPRRVGNAVRDIPAEPRVSVFVAEARALITDIYEDLGRYASFAGLHFQDDARLRAFGDADPDALRALSAFTLTLAEVVRQNRPDIRTSRHLLAAGAMDQSGINDLAQDLDGFADPYDYITLTAMPRLASARDSQRFFDALLAAVAARPGALDRMVFQLQTLDRQQGQPVSSVELRDTLQALQARGVRHLAYYPDDFMHNQPRLADLRQGMSLAEDPWNR
jgi:biofilm PGA synthesis lipoprotein PgaB